jgi:hypothetical protein
VQGHAGGIVCRQTAGNFDTPVTASDEGSSTWRGRREREIKLIIKCLLGYRVHTFTLVMCFLSDEVT